MTAARRLTNLLQFGLDAVVEENRRTTQGIVSGNYASIRPRRCRRGELAGRECVIVSSSQLQFGLDAVVEENLEKLLIFLPKLLGFNSASTLSSRRTTVMDHQYERSDHASIRPRRCRRGELGNCWIRLGTVATLQFGLDAVVEENQEESYFVGL